MAERLESEFARNLKKDLSDLFPGCIILKQNANMRQGIPDLLVLYEDKWAALETKRAKDSDLQVNQDWYQEKMSDMSFSAFVNPQNRDEVLNDLQQAFRPSR